MDSSVYGLLIADTWSEALMIMKNDWWLWMRISCMQSIGQLISNMPVMPLRCVLFDPLIGLTFLFPVSGLRWLNPDPSPAYILLCEMDFLHRFALPSFLVVSPHLFLN